VKAQQLNADRLLAGSGRFGQNGYLLYAYYMGEAAKLENSEKVSPCCQFIFAKFA